MRQLRKVKKVICGMSGGIDSSVAAALLKRAGFEVVGVFMKFWAAPYHFEETPEHKAKSFKNKTLNNRLTFYQSGGGWNRCCSPETEKRASWVAKSLGIPFYVLNLEKEFKRKIVDYFLDGYRKSITPNPCVVCNKEIKFGLLLEKALEIGADYVATGHYARLVDVRHQQFKLLRGRDRVKDQSYFLWQLSQSQLKHILFPLGNYTKTQVRKLAKKFKLPLFDIPESMEICFVQTNINDFLKNYLKTKPGKIVDVKGNVLAEHQGLSFYTIGQRKGIGLSGGPYWVLDKNLKKNFLIVTRNEKELYKKELLAKNVNWIAGKEPKLPLKVKAKIRYRHQPAVATLTSELKNLKTYKLIFDKAQRAITPGQSAVFYKGEVLLGGGIIE